ncbi:MAG: hypothetical protein ACE5G8_08550, partial [Anaerolineae bacterium]
MPPTEAPALPAAANAPTCAEILTEALKQYPGLATASVDHRRSTLTVGYNPAVLSPHAADKIAVELSRRINRREAACNSSHTVQCVDCVALAPHDATHPRIAVVDRGEPVQAVLQPRLNLTDTSLAKVEKRYRRLGRQAPPETRAPWPARNLEAVLAAISLITLLAGAIGGALGLARPWQVGFFAVSYMAGGYTGLVEGVKSLREFSFDVNLLMLAAAIGAAAIGEWEEGAILLFLFSLSGALEGYAMDRTRNAIQGLMDLSPAEALVRRGQTEATVPVEELVAGDIIIIKPGQRIAADAEILT